MKPLRVGLVGHMISHQDGTSARALLATAVTRAIAEYGDGDGKGDVVIVFNMIHTPIAMIGNEMAIEKGWHTVGIIRRGAMTFSGDVEETIVAGDDWAEQLAGNVDVLVRVGGGAIDSGRTNSEPEMDACRARGIPVLEYPL